MRLKKILAVALGATLAVSMATALTACSDDPEPAPAPAYTPLGTSSVEYNIDDYLPPAEGNVISNSKPAFASAVKLTGDNVTLVGSGGYPDPTSLGFAILRCTDEEKDEVSYSVYSTNEDKNILNGLKRQPSAKSFGSISVVVAERTNEETSTTEESYIAADGTKLLDYGKYSEISGRDVDLYVNGEQKKSKVLRVTGYEIKDSVHTSLDKYFVVKTNARTGAKKLTPVSEDAVSEVPEDNKYTTGAYLNSRTPVYQSTEEKPVNGDIADYSYVVTKNSYTFYKDNEPTGSVSLDYGKLLGFVGNYMYYKTETPVYRESTKGFNVVYYTGESGENKDIIEKYDYRLFKYDIIKNSTTELKHSVKIDSLTCRYNYTAKSYDAATITYYDMTDGKFIESYKNNKTCIVDAELKVAIDLNNKVGDTLVTKLADNRYLANKAVGFGYVVVDKNLNYVAEAAGLDSVYQNENLIKVNVDGKYGFIDYDGKIKIEPVYTTIGYFYGDYAYASRSVKGKTQYFLINKNGSVTPAPESDNATGKDVYVTMTGLYRVMTPSNEEKTVNTVDYYNYAGTHLVQFEDITSVYSITIRDKLITYNGTCYALKY